MKSTRPFGLWPSPISPLSLAQGLRLSDVAWDSDGRTLVWLEGRSDRGVLVCARTDDPAPRDLTAELSVRATVGYGGGDFTVADGTVYFISGGRIYRQPLGGGAARPITPGFGSAAAPAVSPDGRWVLFVHTYEDQDCVAVVDAEGGGWPVKLARGRDFYMQPRWHPSGGQIAWVAWDHPNMPWDGTELWVAHFSAGSGPPAVVESRLLAGGAAIAIFQPEFTPDGTAILYVSDESGSGQIYLAPLTGGEPRCLTDGTAEYGAPAWAQGQRTHALVDGGRALLALRAELGSCRLQRIEIASGAVAEVGGDAAHYTAFELPAGGAGDAVALIASSSVQPLRVISVNTRSGDSRVWARAMGETVPAAALPTPRALTWPTETSARAEERRNRARSEPPRALAWPTAEREVAHGLFYPPASERFEATGPPPLIVLVHGGPTSQVTAGFQAQTQFFTTRGYAVLQVNYRGSTGYGRDYMLKLRGNWGLHDVEDCYTGARFLAEQGLVDERRRVIMGGSAGGFTVLQSLVDHPGFYTAALCLFGVSNQFTLVADTHKFEARYSDSLLGPLPEAAAIYRERSPGLHAAAIQDPIALFQGDIDQVVPRSQSDEIVASLKARGVPHEYHVYEGEGHGWRRSDTIERFYSAVDRFLRQYVIFA